MAMIYGFCNCAAFNIRPEGDEQWFSTRTARDEALRHGRRLRGETGAGLVNLG